MTYYDPILLQLLQLLGQHFLVHPFDAASEL